MKPTELFVSRIVRAPRETVFATWTDPELVRRWWGPPPFTCPAAEIDLRIGGAYRLANLGLDGNVIWISGTFTHVEPLTALSYSWQLSTHEPPPSLVHVLFSDHEDGTLIEIHHERFATQAIRDEHADGWEGCLSRLWSTFG